MESGIEDVGLMKEVTQQWILRLLLGKVARERARRWNDIVAR